VLSEPNVESHLQNQGPPRVRVRVRVRVRFMVRRASLLNRQGTSFKSQLC